MPILDPADCILLLLNVTPEPGGQPNDAQFSRRHRLIRAAALAAAVPVYTAMRDGWASNEQKPPEGSRSNGFHSYPSGMIRVLWAERGLAQTIAGHKRSSLILAGCWLEVDITFLALSALADGFDAHVLFDASPSQERDIRQLAIDRILQAGAVPLSTVQMLHEWAESSGDDARRHALLNLVGSDHSTCAGAGR